MKYLALILTLFALLSSNTLYPVDNNINTKFKVSPDREPSIFCKLFPKLCPSQENEKPDSE